MESIQNHPHEDAVGRPPIAAEGSDAEALTALLGNLQGLGDDAMVGTGLARFNPQRLDAIRTAVEQKVRKQLEGISALLQVLTVAMRELDGKLPGHVIPGVTAHLESQTQELACWRELANQVAYIRAHPDFAYRLARQYVRQAEASDEWPRVDSPDARIAEEVV